MGPPFANFGGIMNFVYSCRDGDNEELRYSIRSVKYFYPDSSIWVVGGKPNWYCGNYIKVKQNKNKNSNINTNLLAAYESDNIEENFVYMNDDFFIFNHINTFDFLYDGLLSEKIKTYEEKNNPNGYSRQIRNTEKKLIKMGIHSSLNYELHVPMPVEKSKLKSVLDKKDNLLWRSMYGNIFNVGGIQTKDVKIYKDMIEIDTFISTSEGAPFDLLLNEKLKDMFSYPTTYECYIL